MKCREINCHLCSHIDRSSVPHYFFYNLMPFCVGATKSHYVWTQIKRASSFLLLFIKNEIKHHSKFNNNNNKKKNKKRKHGKNDDWIAQCITKICYVYLCASECFDRMKFFSVSVHLIQQTAWIQEHAHFIYDTIRYDTIWNEMRALD